jgi:hypothetical protein
MGLGSFCTAQKQDTKSPKQPAKHVTFIKAENSLEKGQIFDSTNGFLYMTVYLRAQHFPLSDYFPLVLSF